MCGIAGIVDFERPASLAGDRLQAMLRRLQHRGPDGTGWRDCGHAILGANRLAQVDRAGGAQPMTCPEGRWTVVFNGEIHNHRELRERLDGTWKFRTRSDTEVLLAAIATWGEAALPRLNGMFAFFAWDAENKRGLCVRDRLGVKPLAWCVRNGRFSFASEAKALLECLPDRPVANFDAVLEYLVAPFFSGVARPMFEGLEYLAPGHLLRIAEDGIEVREWWRYELRQGVETDPERLAPKLRNALEQGVARSLDTDTSAAVLLSGGLDSTILAACAGRRSPAVAYTICFEGQDHFDYARSLMVKADDTPYAVEASAALGTEHRLVPVSRADYARDLRTLAVQNDALPAWEQELAQHHLARAVSRDFRAMLVGDAADETHFGYGFLLDDSVIEHPRALLRRFGSPPLGRALDPDTVEALAAHYARLSAEAGHEGSSRAGRLRAATHLIVRRWLPRLLHNGDIHGMAHGVEARVPFADAELLGLAVRVHPELGIRDGIEKWLLREAVRKLVPESIRTRRKSALPRDEGAEEVLRQEARRALDASAPLIGTWLDLRALRSMCDAPGRLGQPGLLFRVIALHHWAEYHGVRLP